MKNYKRSTALLVVLLSALMLLSTPALAAGTIDPEQDGTLTLSYQTSKMPLAGAKFQIYLAATVDEHGELTATETFQQFPLNIRGKNDAAWRELASTMEGYVLRDQVLPTDSGETNEKGIVTFPSTGKKLTPGLYLVLGDRHAQAGDYCDASPFLVMLPKLDKDANAWLYDVTANVKYDSVPIPDTPDKPDTITRKVLKVWNDEGYEEQRPKEVTVQLLRNGKLYDTVTLHAGNRWRHTWTGLNSDYKWTVVEKELEDYTVEVTREGVTFVVTNTPDSDIPDEPAPEGPPPKTPDQPELPDTPVPQGSKLPQTGQLWWPVFFLLCGGLLLVIAGLVRRRGADDEE